MRSEDLREDPRRMNHVKVDPDLCMGCKKCLHTCCYDVYKWDAEKKVSVAAYEELSVYVLLPGRSNYGNGSGTGVL